MKAIILAAGKGERLKEITQSIPKPMIDYKGKPVLQYNIELCKRFGIDEIYINLYHLPEKITEYFGSGEKFGVKIKYSYEDELLGTAGAVKKIANEFWNNAKLQNYKITKFQAPSTPILQYSDPFYVIYGDQISGFNLNALKEKYDELSHADKDCMGVVAYHYREDVMHSGVAEFDNNFRILRFVEKPKEGETESHWVNAGVYYLNPKIADFIEDGFSDFGKQIFPFLIKNNFPLYGVCEKKDVSVFDTPEMYAKTISKE